jgi:phage terminase large subunit
MKTEGMSLDVADEGLDKNAVCISKGAEIVRSYEWTGQGGDIFQTVQRAFELCEEYSLDGFDYDSDGLGAGVRGDARIINDQRRERRQRQIAAKGFRGSEAPFDPDGIVEGTIASAGDKGRTNKDYFANRKAQGWWALRRRFQKTYRWIEEGVECPPDDIISISSKCPNHLKLVAELSQPTYQINGVGKIVINKKSDQMKSPNLADAAMMRFAPKSAPPIDWVQLFKAVSSMPRRRVP